MHTTAVVATVAAVASVVDTEANKVALVIPIAVADTSETDSVAAVVGKRLVAVAMAVALIGTVTYFPPSSLIVEIHSESITSDGTRGMYQGMSQIQE